jgi:predicted phage replisome organizer/uncharacterized phage protein (TIGR02220 family)
MSEVKWIKITTDIFNDEKMLLIESMPDSDSIIVIWFKLLSLAGKSNSGGLVMMSDKVPYTKDMLPILFRRKPTVVELALHTFVQFGMIEILDNDTILVSNWEKHQNIKGLYDIREQNKIRQQRYRNNQKKLLIEQDKEIDLDKEGNVTNNVTNNVIKEKEKTPFKEIIEYLNLKIKGTYKHTTKNTRKYITTRWNEGFTLEDFYKAIDNTYLFRMEKGGDLTYVRPTTIFNGDMENRVNGTAFGFKEEIKKEEGTNRYDNVEIKFNNEE